MMPALRTGRSPRETTVEERFWARVDQSGDCWLWRGALSPDGYAHMRLAGKSSGNVSRIAYELFVGPIPEGLQIDHLCRNRGCVNPAHLEPVTSQENTRRGESPSARAVRTGLCKHGHVFAEVGFYKYAGGGRMCRECALIRGRRQTRSRARGAA